MCARSDREVAAKTRVAVIFGGRSVEHEVSVISGIQALGNLDAAAYEAIPVYIAKDGIWYVGNDVGDIGAYRDIDALVARSTSVALVNDGGTACLVGYPAHRFRNTRIAVDVALPVVHGTTVEDGTLQGHLATVGLPYAGCDVCASAVGMDKHVQKAILRDAGIPVLDDVLLTLADYAEMDVAVSKVERRIAYPIIVKPANLGSSVGIGVAANRDELVTCIDDAFLYARRVIAERAITDLREINCSVVGDEDGAEASVCEEPLHTAEILSYEDKYLGGGGTAAKGGAGTKGAGDAVTGGAKGGASQGMASTSRRIPAPITSEQTALVRELSVRAFAALGCGGVVRIDYLLDSATGDIWLNEINTIPGSLAFYLWEASGVPYAELLDRLIRLALRRARRDDSLTFTFDTNILAARPLGGAKAAKR